jgi:decaprenylphospho-beta-D-erythro-pentofuranosid-2-ulose 2-reductase
MTAGHVFSTGRRVMVLGGTSEIALEIVRELQAQAPREVALLGRDREGLARAAAELGEAGCQRAITFELDALASDRHAEILERAFAELGGADIVVLAVGLLGERGGLPSDIDAAVEVLQVNLVGAGSLLMRCASKLRDQGGGAIVVLSSVAAERPRRANAVYGASKAGLDALARGLGDDLQGEGVRVLVVRPGFVHTRMTRDLPAAPLATTPEVVARAVREGLDSGSQTIWVPGPLRWLMLIMRHLPRPLFRRMKQ